MAYAFAIPNGNGSSASPMVQADYLLAYLAKAGGAPPEIMLDIEYYPYGAECYGLTQAAMVSWITRFDAEIQAKTGQEPAVYTPAPRPGLTFQAIESAWYLRLWPADWVNAFSDRC